MSNVRLIYVQAHGGGTHSLQNIITTYNNYEQMKRNYRHIPQLSSHDVMNRGQGFIDANQAQLPMIARLVSPGKSANSDFESDKFNVNYIKNILFNGTFRSNLNSSMSNISSYTRSGRGAYTRGEGYRSTGELYNNVSFYYANDPIFNETITVEMNKNRRGIFKTQEDRDGDPGGFGIWDYGGDHEDDTQLGWLYNERLSNDILLDSQGNPINVQILDVVNQLTNRYGPNIIVIFPNCSPFGKLSLTDSEERRSRSRTSMSRFTPMAQFQQSSVMLSRIQNFYDGNLNFKRFIQSNVAFQHEYNPVSIQHPEDAGFTGDIGVMDSEDSQNLYQILYYKIQRYSELLNIGNLQDNNELLYLIHVFNPTNIVKLVYILLLFAFSLPENRGGMFRNSDRATLTGINKKIKEYFMNFAADTNIRELYEYYVYNYTNIRRLQYFSNRHDAWNYLVQLSLNFSNRVSLAASSTPINITSAYPEGKTCKEIFVNGINTVFCGLPRKYGLTNGGKKTRKKRRKKRRKRRSTKKLKQKMICHKGTKKQLKKLKKRTKKLKLRLTKCSRKRLKNWNVIKKKRKYRKK
tara:strand:+ start:7870 stop:9600 length:1731 start_codon:yes stop_codon:yes gene_type:complete